MNYLLQLIYDLKTKIVSKDHCVATFFHLEYASDLKIKTYLFIYCLHKIGLQGKNITLIYSFLKNRIARIKRNQSWVKFMICPMVYRKVWSLLHHSS